MTEPTARAFQVDLHGIVDLLARHLYSGPRVYLRELLQNGVDAITARHALDPAAPSTVRLRPLPDGSLTVTDSGVGLTIAEAEELLATVGRSSKRDLDLGYGREEFLGQFGIGLLSAFMVADEIELVSRSARDPRAPAVRWRGHADGSYDLVALPAADGARLPVGSTVRLRPRRDLEHWLVGETVTALATEFGSLLPVDVAVEVPLSATAGAAPVDPGFAPADAEPRAGHAWRRITEPALPWAREPAGPGTPADAAAPVDPAARQRVLTAYCERTLGFTPLAAIDLEVPLAGVSGVAYVLPAAVPPGGGGSHRVYLKRMLLGSRVDGLLPEWAFFVRCVIDATGLRPTASREQLYTDEVLLATQEVLAGAIRDWTLRTLGSGTALARQFVGTHHLAVRSLALTDDAMLDLAARILPYETTDGPLTLAEVAEQHGRVVYAATLEEYRRIAPVARAQGMAVVNAGYVYDADLLARLAARSPGEFRPLGAGDIAQVLTEPAPERELATLDAVRAGDAVLRPLDCELVLREFDPAGLPAVLLHDRDGDHQRDLARTVEQADDLWADVLSGFATPAAARRLVLNDRSPVVRELLAARPGEVFEAGVRSLYVSALLLAGEPLRSREAELMTGSMHVLLRAGLGGAEQRGADDDAGPEPTAGPTREDGR